jgi:oligoribonuclease
MAKTPSEDQPLVFLDLETSGLDPQRDVILEVAAYYENSGAHHRKNLVLHYAPEALADMNPFVVEMHTKNGLLEEVDRAQWNGVASTTAAAEAHLIEWLESALPWRLGDPGYLKPILAGEGIHFDQRFLRVHMPRFFARFDYPLEDISTLKRALRRALGRDFVDNEILPETEAHEAEDRHRAMDDVEEAVRNHRQIAAWLRGPGWGRDG